VMVTLLSVGLEALKYIPAPNELETK
jgi:hypothetical protein